MATRVRKKIKYFADAGATGYIQQSFFPEVDESFLTKAGFSKTRPENKSLLGKTKLQILRNGAGQLFNVTYSTTGGRVGQVSVIVANSKADTFIQEASSDSYKSGAKVDTISASFATNVTVG
ncbi:MAG: hypothetical protein AAF959_07605 [Cyanobacteria bacterium P01_D01_bin.56]